jgi:hypothetical protein
MNMHGKNYVPNSITFGEFVEALNNLPEKYKDYAVSVCGMNHFWVHFVDEEQCITFDTEEYIGEEESYSWL